MLNLVEIGKRIYDTKNPREAHRFAVFFIRGTLHLRKLQKLYDYFMQDAPRRKILAKNPFPIEQATRAFFYNNSTFDERLRLITEHYDFCLLRLKEDAAVALSFDGEFTIWKSETEDWRSVLKFVSGQRKEGLLSLIMYYKGVELYQTMFWFQKDKRGEDSLFIGAIQGANVKNATEMIKETTKLAHRYRTKNLALYMLRAFARAIGVAHIYAVSNDGYYANNHLRRDRKLKTDFGAFWQETGGVLTDDPRFYELPLSEPRKTIEEVPTRKRADYRKRFALLDAIDEKIADAMTEILRAND